MKHIFDWLREQIMTDANLDTECPEFSCWVRTNKNCNECNLKSLQVRAIFDIITEAEGKWESDCKRADFEYRINDVLPMLEEKCLYGTASLIKAMADALGIKISEVSNGMG